MKRISNANQFESLLRCLEHSSYRTGHALEAVRKLLKRVEEATRMIQENHVADQDVVQVLNGLQEFKWPGEIVADVESDRAVRRLAEQKRKAERSAKRPRVIEILIQKEGFSLEEAERQVERVLDRNVEWFSPEELVSRFIQSQMTAKADPDD
jgi:hypothetical protein